MKEYKDPVRDEERANLKRFSRFEVFTANTQVKHIFHLSLDHTLPTHRHQPPDGYFQEEEKLPSTMHSSLVFTSLLPLLASANPLPLEPRQSTLNPFTLIAGRSGSPIHLSAINANGESFWIGKNTASYCPTDVGPDCPTGIYTELLAGDGGASMVNCPLPP